jgi:type II secretory pathway component PulF
MRARRAFYEGLASLLSAGIPVRAAMAQLAEQAGGRYGEALRHVRSAVDGGRPLADGMEERPAAFRRFEVELVRAAEMSGTLDRAARALAADEAESERVQGKILSSLAYPALVLHGVPVPVGLVSGKFLAFAVPWYAVLWGSIALGWWLLREARRGGPAARVLLAVPFLGGLLRDAALLRWARTFAALEDAGVRPEPCALRAAASTGLHALEAPLAAPALRLRTGSTRADAFAGAPLPADLYAALVTGETSGTIAESLRRAADVREVSLSTRTDSALALLPAAGTILAGAGVLYAAMKVLGGYYSIR